MIQINLLPWREQARQIKKKKFVFLLANGVCIPLAILILFHVYLSNAANAQQSLNDTLQAEISQQQNILNEESNKIKELAQTDLQLKFIIDIYSENYYMVRVLNELVSMVSSSIHIDQIKEFGEEVSLAGVAESENNVSELMHNIANSPYFNQPILVSIALDSDSQNTDRRRFKLKFVKKQVG